MLYVDFAILVMFDITFRPFFESVVAQWYRNLQDTRNFIFTRYKIQEDTMCSDTNAKTHTPDIHS